MAVIHIDKREVLEGIKTTTEHSPAMVQTIRFWDYMYERVNPYDKETILFVASLEKEHRGEIHISLNF